MPTVCYIVKKKHPNTVKHVHVSSGIMSWGFWSGARAAQLFFLSNKYLTFTVKINKGSHCTLSISPSPLENPLYCSDFT